MKLLSKRWSRKLAVTTQSFSLLIFEVETKVYDCIHVRFLPFQLLLIRSLKANESLKKRGMITQRNCTRRRRERISRVSRCCAYIQVIAPLMDFCAWQQSFHGNSFSWQQSFQNRIKLLYSFMQQNHISLFIILSLLSSYHYFLATSIISHLQLYACHPPL